MMAQKPEEGEQVSRAPAPVVSVTEFGARGDGVSDDQPAIQKAIDTVEAAGGGTVILPPSEQPYVVGASVTIRGSQVKLLGYGATVKLADHAGDGRVVDVMQVVGRAEAPVEDVVIAGLTVDGNYWAQSEAHNPRCLDCAHALRALVRDCQFTRGFVTMTFGKGCHQCTALNCTATRWHNDGFSASGDGVSGGCTGISFINCHARESPNDNDGGLPGRRDGAWEIEDGAQDVWLVNCSVERAGGSAFTVRNHTSYAEEVTESINFVNCWVSEVRGAAWGVSSRTEANVTRRIRLLNCRADRPVKLVSGVAEVAISGEFMGGLLLGSPKSGPPLREVEIGNVRTNYLSLFAHEVRVANLAVQADGPRGIELHDGCSDVEMVHCTVTGASEAGIACANVPAFIANSILWGNAAALAVEGPEEPTLSHCCVEGGLPEGCRDGGGNITEDPLLAGAGSGDLRLREGSPCAGAGLPLSELSLRLRAMAGRDLEGRPRPEPPGSPPELGAWESGV